MKRNLEKSNTPLPIGIYELLISEITNSGILIAKQHQLKANLRTLDPADSHTYFAKYIAEHVHNAFSSLPENDRLFLQVDLSNRIIRLLAKANPKSINVSDAKILRAELLTGIFQTPIDRPDTPLSSTCLMTGTRQDPSLVSQFQKEFRSADHVDILSSFIKWGGIRILEDSIKKHSSLRRELRIITTSYMGATELKAIDFLEALSSTQIKISYDTRRTRLHAKAYIFHRKSGFGTAYIGSSNLSQAALTDGLEWNVKISQYESPILWAKVIGTFETYWNDKEFVTYHSSEHEVLKKALEDEHSNSEGGNVSVYFDIKPYPYQEEILDKLEAERTVHGRNKNLVVAATGTGKTLIAAFDYRRFVRRGSAASKESFPRILFVAHREEILKQSLSTFRAVLRDQNFGSLLVGQNDTEKLDHLFTSIQSFNSRSLWETIRADHFEYVVVDEFHHAAAPSYKRLLEFVRPEVLLGLTATPERMDGLDILSYFGGHVAAEIRLPDAINRKLLCPFQYFGITDSVNYDTLHWQRGGYLPSEVNGLLTGNDIRAQLVIDKVRNCLLDVHTSRGLGFCVSVAHAQFMASVFNKAGIRSISLTAESSAEERRSVNDKLVRREINFVFVVDLYNEGIDIPQIDTVLFLRPTESLTVFLQQFGRGLRIFEGKDCLTVLDFIGRSHEKFNFEARFRALLGQSSNQISDELENGFPHLPSGCVINLERIASDHILENIRNATNHNRNQLVARIGSFTNDTGLPLTFGGFLEYYRLQCDDIYKRDTWSRLCVVAGIRPEFQELDETLISKGLRRVAYLDDVLLLKYLIGSMSSLLEGNFREPRDEVSRRYLLMLHFTLWSGNNRAQSLTESMLRLAQSPTILNELIQLLRYRLDLVQEVPNSVDVPFLCPLQLHSSYSRDQILTALGVWTIESQREVREGVAYIPSLPADLFFVTLNKSEDEYSPTTMYDDYAISEDQFHWQSQSTTSVKSATGQRYISQAVNQNTILLFVREEKQMDGLTSPYYFLGPVDYVSHSGNRPISVIWKLRHRIMSRLLRQVRRMAND